MKLVYVRPLKQMARKRKDTPGWDEERKSNQVILKITVGNGHLQHSYVPKENAIYDKRGHH